MRSVLALLVVAAVSVSLPAAADEAEPAVAASTGNGAAVAPSNAHTLAQVHGGLTAESSRGAGLARDIEMTIANGGAAARVVRPTPTPRVLRRMSPERVVNATEPAVRACASSNAANAPTTFGLRISVAPGGEVEGAEVAPGMRVPAALLACVVKAVSTARFGAPGAAGATIVLPITVPGRAVATPADAAAVAAPAPAPAPAPSPAPVAAQAKPEEASAGKP